MPGLAGDTTARPLAIGPANELQPALSPDGKWLAYTADDLQGVRDVFVMSFPGGGAGRLVSRGGGSEPRWARRGRELFFESGGSLVSVAVGVGATLEVSEPKPLFSLLGYRRARNRAEYDVAPAISAS